MTNEITGNTLNQNESEWKIIVFSQNTQFLNSFLSSIDNSELNGLTVVINCYSDLNEFLYATKASTKKSIIHFDTSNHSENEMNEIFDAVQNVKDSRSTYLVVWSENPWKNFSESFLQSRQINDFRSKANLFPNRLQHIIFTNIKNHEQYVELENLKSNLEESIALRTKKLETALKKNSRVNSEILQRRNQIEKQNIEINNRNDELERAFKKSSSQHIKLHKALMQNEEQRKNLEEALEEISSKNEALKSQNEEISSQRDHIEQQREEIQAQRDMALTQQEEIHDNIQYASRIQHALFPPPELIEQLLPQNFVLNKPKDIVSGDFYWISQNRGKTIIAVSDCTGHGISGAMMSMLGTAFLNEIVNRNDVTNSTQILDQLRERVISSLHQQMNDGIEYSRDGMDIAIAIIDIVDNTLEYSGANNPLYLYRKEELIELKPDKMPIGIHEFYNEPFNSHKISLQSGDTIYMFSDGYADQFGGKRGKKLKYSRFKSILAELTQLPYNQRKASLDNTFEKWRGENEQIDDVLVLGFDIN